MYSSERSTALRQVDTVQTLVVDVLLFVVGPKN